MSRLRLALLAAVVAALTSVAIAASAQAHFYRVSGAELGAGAKDALEANTETAQTQELLGTPFGVATHINCSKLATSGEIEGTNKGKATLKYSECTVTKPANCTVKEPIEVKATTLLVGSEPGVEVEFKPETSETFTTITLLGASCSIKEPFNVTGTQKCKLPSGETAAESHEIACETSGSTLKAGGKTATYKGGVKALKLSKGEFWDADGPGEAQDLLFAVTGGGNPPTQCLLKKNGDVCTITFQNGDNNEELLVIDSKLDGGTGVFSVKKNNCPVNTKLEKKGNVKDFCQVEIELISEVATEVKYILSAKSQPNGWFVTASVVVKQP
jgi:hypothetical protein